MYHVAAAPKHIQARGSIGKITSSIDVGCVGLKVQLWCPLRYWSGFVDAYDFDANGLQVLAKDGPQKACTAGDGNDGFGREHSTDVST
jgi:hypothetical protein